MSNDVLSPQSWVVEHSLAWTTRFLRLVKDPERNTGTPADLRLVVFVCLVRKQAAEPTASSY